MQSLEEAIKTARALGLSYGEYVAQYLSREARDEGPEQKPKSPMRQRRYTDEQAFAMWKEGKSDSQIGKALGVSRQIIQRWRDTMELPSTMIQQVDTGKYHLITTKAGTFIVMEDESGDATQETEETM